MPLKWHCVCLSGTTGLVTLLLKWIGVHQACGHKRTSRVPWLCFYNCFCEKKRYSCDLHWGVLSNILKSPENHWHLQGDKLDSIGHRIKVREIHSLFLLELSSKNLFVRSLQTAQCASWAYSPSSMLLCMFSGAQHPPSARAAAFYQLATDKHRWLVIQVVCKFSFFLLFSF